MSTTTPEPAATEHPAPATPPPSLGWGAKFTIGLVVTLIAGGGIAMASGDGSSSGSGAYASDITYSVVDPSTVDVTFTVNGEPGTTPSCTVEAENPSGAYRGWDITDVPLDSTSRTGTLTLTVSNDGAAYVTDVTVDCS